MENDNNNLGFENGNQQQFDQTQNGMENQQFNQTQNGFEGQQYNQQQNNFGGQQYNQQQNNFNGQQNMYGQNAYGQTPNYGMGGVPVDKNGQPLKNRFGMKLTFSILEILTLMSCNLLTGILGIIACVFTAKANTAYKESRWDDFKSAAKTSAICLWIGLGGFVLELILLIVSIVTSATIFSSLMNTYGYNYDDYSDYYSSDDYNTDDYSYDYDYDYETDDSETEESETTDSSTTVTPSDVTAGAGITDTTFSLNGVSLTFPMSYTDFKAAGFYMDASDESYVLNGGYYTSVTLYDANGNDIGYVSVYDNTDAAITLAECVVYGVDLYYKDYYDVVGDIVLPNGVTASSTKEDIVTAYGEPDDLYESDSYDSQDYTWYYHNDAFYDSYQNSIEISYWDGVIDEISISYMGWE